MSRTMEAQNSTLLRFMQNGGRITQKKAAALFGCYRLPARVSDLKEAGFPVESDWEYEYDHCGKVVRKWKVYWMPKENGCGCRLTRNDNGLYDLTVTDDKGRTVAAERNVSFRRAGEIIARAMSTHGEGDADAARW